LSFLIIKNRTGGAPNKFLHGLFWCSNPKKKKSTNTEIFKNIQSLKGEFIRRKLDKIFGSLYRFCIFCQPLELLENFRISRISAQIHVRCLWIIWNLFFMKVWIDLTSALKIQSKERKINWNRPESYGKWIWFLLKDKSWDAIPKVSNEFFWEFQPTSLKIIYPIFVSLSFDEVMGWYLHWFSVKKIKINVPEVICYQFIPFSVWIFFKRTSSVIFLSTLVFWRFEFKKSFLSKFKLGMSNPLLKVCSYFKK